MEAALRLSALLQRRGGSVGAAWDGVGLCGGSGGAAWGRRRGSVEAAWGRVRAAPEVAVEGCTHSTCLGSFFEIIGLSIMVSYCFATCPRTTWLCKCCRTSLCP